MSWATLFERAAEYEVTVDDVRAAVTTRRDERAGDADSGPDAPGDDDSDPSPTRIVADADVLAADLFVGGPAREALDSIRAHSWLALVASDALLADAEAVVADLADPDLAADWRAAIEKLREPVGHPAGDHPALASALRGGAMHVLSLDEGLQSAAAAAAVRGRVETSIRSPRAFAAVFDARSLYEAVEDGDYPGPDRDPRGD
jgi:hypothetical protein